MIEQKEHFHGSDLEKIEKIFIAAKANPQVQPVIDRVYQSAENKIKKKIEKLINNNA